MLCYYLFKKKSILGLLPEQQAFEKRYTRLVGWFFGVTSLMVIVVFGYFLPHMFSGHWSKMGHEAKEMPMEDMMKQQTIKESDFHVTLTSSPAIIQAGKPFTLKIALHDKAGRHIKDLQVSHERILHVILVSEDLEEFKHVHPEDSGPLSQKQIISGEFSIPLTLSKSGRYRVLVDANRSGSEVSTTNWLNVSGTSSALLIKKDLTRDKLFDKYKVVLNVQPRMPKTGEEIHLSYYLERNGKQALETDKFLGADMHLVITSLDLSTMIHTHGLRSATQENLLGEIDGHYTFPFPGLWKIYGQFQHKGKVVTTEFMVEVAAGTQSAQVEAMPHMH